MRWFILFSFYWVVYDILKILDTHTQRDTVSSSNLTILSCLFSFFGFWYFFKEKLKTVKDQDQTLPKHHNPVSSGFLMIALYRFLNRFYWSWNTHENNLMIKEFFRRFLDFFTSCPMSQGVSHWLSTVTREVIMLTLMGEPNV